MNGPVVVGVDGSASALAAVEIAAREAKLRGVGLQVVHAFIWPSLHVSLGPSPVGPPDGGLRNAAEKLLSEAATRARETEPGVHVTEHLVTGEPLTILEARSREASLVVVGSRGMGGFIGLLVGSTAVHLAAHGRCPVLVVRGDAGGTGPVVVAVDGSARGDAAVEFAFAEASARGVDLVAVHAWNTWTERGDDDPGHPQNLVDGIDRMRSAEERLLAESLAGRQDRYPDVTVHHRLVENRIRQALIEATEQAQLIVVGARGRGGFAGLLLGSVSQALLHHGHCPVAVVRGDNS
ncbi:universal stress protein [Streptomyces qinzhouensis]|uniref:Universal stress protein n=1 Tax=Streptomyces qinzhouensis TaxID=2599401 RepID=A0A5B8JRZ0_9ACTN|nr:universal stress protein [Streptomyces qinzhouensis]QDY80553.1 universal stress protein [Streptomyces qinzhouensis]